jgi:1-phosphofructokinase family hexose kinase
LIVAAGLTPAWQQIMRFDSFRPGQVNRARELHWCASGKVLNVAVALAHLGAECETVALVGGATGEQIEREFQSLGIRRQWAWTHWATRTCTTILDVESGQATELVENAGPVTHSELDSFAATFHDSVAKAQLVVLTGSLPARAPNSFFRDLLATVTVPMILDIRGPELIKTLERPVFAVKPNREELAATLARDLSGDRELQSAMRELNARGAEWVIVTDGPRPAWASSATGIYRFFPVQIEVCNPIGSGDCLAAGFAWATGQGREPQAAIRYGLAAAAENARQILPARLDPEAVLRRAQEVKFERVD